MTADSRVIAALHDSLTRHAARPAFVVRNDVTTYGALADDTLALAAQLAGDAPGPGMVGFLCQRDQSAYRAVLAILLAGKGYVPLNPKLPLARLRHIALTAGLEAVVVGPGCEALAQALLAELPGVAAIDPAAPGARAADWRLPAVTANDPAYLLFTSGSTGEPKGVAVAHGNLAAYLDFVTALYDYGPTDVHSQTFELTFDLSVHDMLCAWTTGGCLVRMSGAELLAPVRLVQRHAISSWFSVPSLAAMFAARGGLTPGCMPSLRVSLFCGEALPASLAATWAASAPDSVVENLYGPTEATIAITRYRWEPMRSPDICRHGLAPIGAAFSGQRTLVVDEDERPLDGAARGMLWLGGSQVTGHYWRDAAITREKYRDLDGATWYVTGDLVERDADGCLHFLGRSDSQIKFHGYRIELAEIEHALREVAGTELAVVVPWPVEGTRIDGLTAAIEGQGDDAAILERLRARLPAYMVPQAVRWFAPLPRNLSGKLDRKAVQTALANDASAAD